LGVREESENRKRHRIGVRDYRRNAREREMDRKTVSVPREAKRHKERHKRQKPH
jgi:hypothetical protein